MAITYLNSNIIKMYYGGNEITQAYLNGDHFLPVSQSTSYVTDVKETADQVSNVNNNSITTN